MEMNRLPYIYEALADSGMDPGKARVVERAIFESQISSDTKILDQMMSKVNLMMTRDDGLELEHRLDQKIEQRLTTSEQRLELKIEALRTDMLSTLNGQMRWYVGLMFVAVAASTTAIAILHKIA